MLCGTEQLMGSLPEVKWAQQVRSLSTELQEESLRVIVRHLPQVIRTQAFQDLRRVSQRCSSGGSALLASVVDKRQLSRFVSRLCVHNIRFLVKTHHSCQEVLIESVARPIMSQALLRWPAPRLRFSQFPFHVISEGRVYTRAHVVEEAVLGRQRRCDCGQLL